MEKINPAKEMGKERAKNLNNLISVLKEKCVKFKKSLKDNTIRYEFVKCDNDVLSLDVIFYKNAWKVKCNFKGISAIYRGTTQINAFVQSTLDNLDIDDEELHSLTEFESELIKLNKEVNEIIRYQHSACINGLNYDKDKIHQIFYSFEPRPETTDALNWFEFYNYAKEASHDMYELDRRIMLNIIAKRIVNFMRESKNYNVAYNSTIKADSNPICYAHVLQYYGGKCHNLHGHNGKLSIKAKMNNSCLIERPMLISYGFLKGFLKHMDKKLDHKTFLHLNPVNVLEIKEDTVTFETDRLSITLKDPESYVIIPTYGNSPYMTSEMTLMNYVIPEFYSYLIEFIMTEGIDNTDMTMYQLDEPVVFEFSWGETDSTVCSIEVRA